jgi:transcriptional regulator with XRE-family HTH domain
VVGKQLIALRERFGFSQVELAKLSTIDQSYISRLEAGHNNNPSLDTLIKLARAFDMSVAELIAALDDSPFVSAARAA